MPADTDAADPSLRLESTLGRLVVTAMVLGSTVTYLSATVVNVAAEDRR